MSTKLSVRTATYVVIACMVGSGVLTTSGFIVQGVGSHLWNLLLWVLGGAISLAGAMTMGEMSTAYPHAGGEYVYVRRALGDAWGFVFGWASLVIGFAAPIALVAYTTGNYLYEPLSALLDSLGFNFVSWLDSRSFNLIFATAVISFLTVMHAKGYQESSLVQELTTLFKLFVFVAMLCAGLVLMPDGAFESLTTARASSVPKASALALGLVQVMYAYTGWSAAVYIASELPDPRRNVPRSLWVGTCVVMVLYLALNLLYAIALPVHQIDSMTSDQIGTIAAFAMRVLVGEAWGRIFSLLISLGMLASLSAFILTGPRIAYAMSLDGLMHRSMGKLRKRTALPVSAIVFQGVLALLLLWSGQFEDLLNYAGFGLAVMSLISVSVIFILRKKSGYEPSFKIWGYPWLPGFFCLLSLYMLIGSAQQAPLQAMTGVVMLLLGFPVYHLMRKAWR